MAAVYSTLLESRNRRTAYSILIEDLGGLLGSQINGLLEVMNEDDR
jgi:hypothetical protein